MQKYLLLLIIALLSIHPAAKAQSSEHLTFKGVEIDGTLNGFVGRMKQQGFKFEQRSGGVVYLRGDFATFHNCYIAVSTSREKDLVSQIEVSLPKRDSWSAVTADYYSLKEALTEKYGEPTENVEKVQSIEGTTTTTATTAEESRQNWSVQLSSGRYYSSYVTDKGTVQLSIEPTYLKIYVMLIYKDRINGGIMMRKAMEDL